MNEIKLAIDNTLRCQEHCHREGSRKDDILTGIQKCKRGGNFSRRRLVLCKMLVILCDLILLIVEMLLGATDQEISGNCVKMIL